MRSFSKKLAFVLAAAMVVTSFAPAAKAEAAKEMAINKSSQILYVNEGINHKGGEVAAPGKGNVSVYDFSVKNKPADWKDTLSFKWTSSDEDVVTVKAGGVATAVSVGKATITCKVTDKATKETVATLKTKITVKANADEVEIINADDVAGLAYEVGATVDLNRAMYDENGERTTKRGTVVTDYTRWIAEPSTGVTIDQKTGKYTFAEAGEYTLYCETYQSSKYTKTTATSEKITVTVASGLEIKQTVNNVFEVSFGKAMDVALDGVEVLHVIKGVDGATKDECLVKKVTMSEDKKTAIVEMFYEFEDGEEYEITVKGYDTETMIASNGIPVKAVLHADKNDINGRQVLVGAEAPIYFKLYDANGVQVESGTTSEDLEKADIEYSIKYANTDYENAGNTLFFNEAGDRAIVTLTYHTWNYDNETAEEIGAFTSSPFTFVAVNKATVVVKTLKDYAVNSEYWRGANKNVVKMRETNKWLEVKLVLSDKLDKELVFNDPTAMNVWADDNETLLGELQFKSLNEDVLGIAVANVRGSNPANPAFNLVPRKVGTALVRVYYVTDVNGVPVETTVGTVKIVVSDNTRMTTVTPWANTTTIVTDPAPATDANFRNKEYGFTVKDQYGDDYTNYEIKTIEGTTNLSKKAVELGAIYTTDNGKKFKLDDGKFETAIKFFNNDATSGSFFFTITVQDPGNNYATKTVNFSVYARVKDNDPKTTLAIDVNMDNVNWVGGNVARIYTNDGNRNNENQKFAAFTVYQMYNGGKYNEIALAGRKTKAEPTASGQYYYTVKRNGAEMVWEQTWNDDNYTAGTIHNLKNVAAGVAIGNGNSVVVNFTNSEAYEGNQAYKNDIINGLHVNENDYFDVMGGAGTYEFILWESVYNEKTGHFEYARKLSKAITTTFDAGKYTFQERLAVSVEANSGNETDMQKKLLGAFKIADRSGNTYDKDSTGWNNIVDGSHVNMGGHQKIYNVKYRWVNATETSVYVEEISFWEEVQAAVADDPATTNVDESADAVYMEYIVPVGYYVTIK